MKLNEVWSLCKHQQLTLEVLRLLSSNEDISLYQAVCALTDEPNENYYVSIFVLNSLFRIARYDLNPKQMDNAGLARHLVAAIESDVWCL